MDKITQSMKYRYALVQYALKHGVSAASRRYEKGRSYIYFWLKRFDGEMRSLGLRSRRPHHHPSEQTPEEMELILRYYRHNQDLGLLEFWFKLREVGYTRHYVSLYRAMQYPGQRVQIDVKFVPTACIKDKTWKRYYQYTAIDEYSRLRYLDAYQQADTFSSADFIARAVRWFKGQPLLI